MLVPLSLLVLGKLSASRRAFREILSLPETDIDYVIATALPRDDDAYDPTERAAAALVKWRPKNRPARPDIAAKARTIFSAGPVSR